MRLIMLTLMLASSSALCATVAAAVGLLSPTQVYGDSADTFATGRLAEDSLISRELVPWESKSASRP